jgi:hypothetical protein
LPAGVVLGDTSPSQHAHRLAERQTVAGGTTLDRLKFIESPAQAFVVDFDPLAAYQDQPVGMGQEPLDFGRRESFTVERHVHAEVGACAPIVALTCGRAGRFIRQLAGIRTATPALSSAGTSFRNCSACCGLQRSG